MTVSARQSRRRLLPIILAPALFLGFEFGPIARIAAADSQAGCAAHASASDREERLQVGGVERSYLITVPANVVNHAPLILAFHGRGQSPAMLEQYSGLSALPAVVVYPRGLPGTGGKLSWSGMPTAAPDADDVRFTGAILDRLESEGCVDPQRVYATGKSDGGGFAAILACRLADRIVAVASVAGAYYPIADGCHPARSMPILEIHGTADSVIPYDGLARRELPDVHEWLEGWAARDGCTDEHPADDVAGTVSRQQWTACRGGVSVVGYRIGGGGHTWPGALAPSGPGATSNAINATAVIASFFGLDGRS